MKSAAPYLLCLPGLLLGSLVIFYLVYEIVTMSMAAVNRFGLVGGFAGLKNFHNIFADPLFYVALWNTAIWTLFVVGGTILISVPVAMILSSDFHGRAVARILVMLPWFISLSMLAIVWAWGLTAKSAM